MNDRLTYLVSEIKKLETSLIEELDERKKEFQYTVHKKKVLFEQEILAEHKKFHIGLFRYLLHSRPVFILFSPIIYFQFLPILFLDLSVTIYQTLLFPLYRIPKVKRSEYIVLDRHQLKYMNLIERINCDYCAYFNGAIAYTMEIAARTEQYWCPIKHARRYIHRHDRYNSFFEFGDAESYRLKLHDIRKGLWDGHPDNPFKKEQEPPANG